MNEPTKRWTKGRGKLGLFDPLLGMWRARVESELGEVECTREFTRILGGAYVQLTADWKLPAKSYKELALIGASPDGRVTFWSFTSDRKQSTGQLADVTDIHPQAIGFEAEMPAGLARMAYWPDGEKGFWWAVESKSSKGWRRFTEHHYAPVRR